ncbi:hypothetical protein G6F55_001356 [Rhizopus delemar]|uniref:ER membrane protein complex subunit 1 n=2 Tax=Rhizopus TaxID=4842 RepID=A0A9P6YW39_9FUNG|nr:hypothetical protein G6F55_001356 [Rhizopus delemar]KAG1521400.1 hypothetical protein G6F52_006780 [Rhizopus delemar]KAG1553382.1 hypothetical protein G6F51_000638 [Rhizopus arrhizus]KAG1565655.1 hypothetical protein G6F50_009869 [Rhizopus delemar]KAG1637385.1 hypothetical protein G6F45_000587 [Rhizopus arrhizus]
MQWRPLILLFSGIATIYIQPLHTIQPKADTTILTAVDEYVYFTLIYYQISEKPRHIIGTEKLKLGVRGVVRQLRKPISILTGKSESEQDWSEVRFDTLDGQISCVSQRGQDYVVLYHVIQNDTVMHYARLYYTRKNKFEYKDIQLPGSTWINSISLQDNSFIISRDPDQYQFQVIPFPLNMKTSPETKIIIDSSEAGKLIDRVYHNAVEQYPVLLSKLYSSFPDNYRLLIHNLYKTESEFSAAISIVDNVTLADGSYWREWAYTEDNHTIYYDESMDNVGFADNTIKDGLNNIRKRPKIVLALSLDTKTIVFPSVSNRFFSFDFMDKIDILQKMETEKKFLYPIDSNKTSYLPEYYYQRRYDLETDSEIVGIQLNDDATMMALWTEHNHVYIYSRKVNETTVTIEKTRMQEWVDLLFPDEEEHHVYREHLPIPWKLTMVITPSTFTSIGHVRFYKDNLFFVALNNGHIYSYRLDQTEKQKPVNFITFINDKWDMLIAMCVIISIFVYNEFQHFA